MEFAETYLHLKDESNTPIKGDCEAQGHEGDIDILKWGWGFSMEPVDNDANRSEASYIRASLIGFSKPVDAASLALINHFHSGTCCKEAVFFLKQSTDEALSVKLTLKNTRLMSYHLNVDDDGKLVALSEDWSMSFDSMTLEYMAPGIGNKRTVKTFSLPTGATIDGAPPKAASSVMDLSAHPPEVLQQALELSLKNQATQS